MSLRAELKELLEKMGVGYVLGPYETCPWSHYNSEKGLTCSAEVRMSSSNDEVEAEIQLMYDSPPPGKASMEQICQMKCGPVGDGMWSVITLRIKGEAFGEGIYDWQGKACSFMSAVAQSLQLGEIPDFDELIDEEFHGGERFADQRGGGGKSPKIRAGQLLNMKKGQGF